MATSNAVRGLGLLTSFWKAVEEEIRAIGGTDETLAQLDKKDARPAIREFAKLVVNGTARAVSLFRDMIAAAQFDYTYGYATHPEDIEGQAPHPVTREVELDHPGQVLTIRQVWERYGDQMADLSEFLDYLTENPHVQRQHWIGIVWKDEDGQFWSADASGGDSHRSFAVIRNLPGFRWDDHHPFLRRKPARNATA